MKQCVQFPDTAFLAVRPCLVAICGGNRPASKLLSVLLYRQNLRLENKEDAENLNAIKKARGENADQDTSFRIYRTQEQLIDDMCGDITAKTLHDVAVPMLQVLGYLEIEENMAANCYIVNIQQVQAALNLYKPKQTKQDELEKFLIENAQLEKFLISTDELEKFLIDKKNFQSQLEKVLIWNRNISNYKRGRKVSAGAGLKGKNKAPKNIEETIKNSSKDVLTSANASTNERPATQPLEKKETVKQPPLVREEKSNRKQEILLTPEEQEVFDSWCQMAWFKGVKPPLQKNDPEHLQTLAPYKPTIETMYAVRNWATSPEVDYNGWYKKRGWSLYALAKELPKWLSIQAVQAPAQSSGPKRQLDPVVARQRELAAKYAS